MDSADLAARCADRGLLTPELHPSNDFYGHAAILKRYAHLPGWRPLKVAVEHSVMLHDEFWAGDLQTHMPIFLCGSEKRAQAFTQRFGGRKRAVAIGPMLHYALADEGPSPPAERRLLVFPTHSSHLVTASYDAEAFIRWVEVHGRSFDRTVVCVYWKDVLRGLHNRFLDRGLACVSAGHMFSPKFLPNLIRIIGGASSVITNDVGSHLLYAVLMGKPVWVRPQQITSTGSSIVIERTDFEGHGAVRRLFQLFSEERSALSSEQAQFVFDLTGMASVRSRSELYSLLMQCEVEYRRQLTPALRLRHWVRRARFLGRAVRAKLNGGLLRPDQ